MPNWTSNTLQVSSAETFDRLTLDGLSRDRGTRSFSFQDWIPMPESLSIERSCNDRAVTYVFLTLSKEEQEKYVKIAKDNGFYNFLEPLLSLNKDKEKKELLIASSEEEIKLDRDYSGNIDRGEEIPESDKVTYVEFGKQSLDNLVNYGAFSWYEWRYNNWGTKWDISEPSFDEDSMSIYFDTAWAPPDAFFINLTKEAFRDEEFILSSVIEDDQGILYETLFKNGEIVYEDSRPSPAFFEETIETLTLGAEKVGELNVFEMLDLEEWKTTNKETIDRWLLDDCREIYKIESTLGVEVRNKYDFDDILKPVTAKDVEDPHFISKFDKKRKSLKEYAESLKSLAEFAQHKCDKLGY